MALNATGSGGANGSYTGVQLTYVSGETATTYPKATVVVSGGAVTSVTITTEFTGVALGNPTLLTAAAGDIGGVTPFSCTVQPFGSYERSTMNSTMQVVTTSALNTFTTIQPNTSGYTGYISGGTVEKCSYAICIGEAAVTNSVRNKMFRDIQFFNNYGHIFVAYSAYVNFENMDMYGSTNGGYGLYVGWASSDIRLANSYMESGIATIKKGVRNLTIENVSVVFSASSTWTSPWLYSEGINSTYSNIGGEVAGLYINNVTVNRATTSTASVPVIFTDSYQMTINRLMFADTGSVTPPYVLRDAGCIDLRVQDVTVQAAAAWDLFHPYSLGGTRQIIDGITYTQGTKGSITLSNNNVNTTNSPFVSVKNATADIDVRLRTPAYKNFQIENVVGDVDLTNVSETGSFLFNVSGTVTDPNYAVTFALTGVSLKINPYYTYANNAAAVAAGLVVGSIYKTSVGVVMVVV